MGHFPGSYNKELGSNNTLQTKTSKHSVIMNSSREPRGGYF